MTRDIGRFRKREKEKEKHGEWDLLKWPRRPSRIYFTFSSIFFPRSRADFRNSCPPDRLRRWNQVKRFTVLYNYLDWDSMVLPHLHLRLALPRQSDTRACTHIIHTRAYVSSRISRTFMCKWCTCVYCVYMYTYVCVHRTAARVRLSIMRGRAALGARRR